MGFNYDLYFKYLYEKYFFSCIIEDDYDLYDDVEFPDNFEIEEDSILSKFVDFTFKMEDYLLPKFAEITFKTKDFILPKSKFVLESLFPNTDVDIEKFLLFKSPLFLDIDPIKYVRFYGNLTDNNFDLFRFLKNNYPLKAPLFDIDVDMISQLVEDNFKIEEDSILSKFAEITFKTKDNILPQFLDFSFKIEDLFPKFADVTFVEPFIYNNIYISLNFFNVELFLIVFICFIIVYNLIFSSELNYPTLVKNSIYFLVLTVIFSILLLLNQFCLFTNGESLIFYFNSYSFSIKIFILFVFAILLLLCINYYYKNFIFINNELILIMMLSIVSIFFIVSSNNLVFLYLILEFQSFCFYVMASLKTKSLFSTEAGLKYFIMGSFSSTLLLFGISLLYSSIGSVNMYDIILYNTLIDTSSYIILMDFYYIGLILLLIGLLFKLGLVPFHMYMPDVYSGVYSFMTLFFLIVQKITIFTLLVNIYFSILFKYLYMNQFVIICILASIIIGSFYALIQFKVKKLIIYSAIVNSGFLLLGLIVNKIDGLSNSYLFLLVYIITTLLLFVIYLSTNVLNTEKSLITFYDLLLLKKTHVLIAVLFTIGLFSIAGIPPLAGFFGKLFLFFSVIKESYYVVAIIAIFFTVVTSYYYITLIKILFFEKITRYVYLMPYKKIESILISLFTLFLIFFFINPKLILNYINYIIYLVF